MNTIFLVQYFILDLRELNLEDPDLIFKNFRLA